MAQLAIKGHEIRGEEVIELLKMLGGKNYVNHSGNRNVLYFIHNSGEILADFVCLGSNYFTLEEFEKKFPYKIGDKVQHKGATSCGSVYEVDRMQWIDNHVEYTIKRLWYWNDYHTVTANDLQPYKEETMEGKDKAKAPKLTGQDYSGKRFGYKLPDGYEFDCIENNEIILKPIKPNYPKTYEECCGVLNIPNDKRYIDIDVPLDYNKLLYAFTELLIYRDAYWKIAGEEMELGKPWKPYWTIYEHKFCLGTDKDKVIEECVTSGNRILAFPTAEMRDAFYENFKELIEKCKELL